MSIHGAMTRSLLLAVFAFAASAFAWPPPAVQRPPAPDSKDVPPPRRHNPKAGADDAVIERYFADCDENGNGWISFREAESAMGLSRQSFAEFDKDRDGRIDPVEFKLRYEAIKKFGGAFPAPTSSTTARRGPARTPDTLVRAYDKNADGILDSLELKRLLDENAGALPSDVALEILDLDRSGKLEAAEIAHLASILSRSAAPQSAGPAPESIDELFAKRMKRPSESTGSTALSLWIPGPVSAFERLDYDEDGQLSASDLVELARPLQVPVRIHALIAALDTDGDGTLSESEFRASMR